MCLKAEAESYTTVLVCHGNVIRFLALKALQLDPQVRLCIGPYLALISVPIEAPM